MANKVMGRPRIFEKDGKDIHGRIAKAVEPNFETQRKKLGRLYAEFYKQQWKGKISDGDVITFMLRGEVGTRLLWKGETK